MIKPCSSIDGKKNFFKILKGKVGKSGQFRTPFPVLKKFSEDGNPIKSKTTHFIVFQFKVLRSKENFFYKQDIQFQALIDIRIHIEEELDSAMGLKAFFCGSKPFWTILRG